MLISELIRHFGCMSDCRHEVFINPFLIGWIIEDLAFTEFLNSSERGDVKPNTFRGTKNVLVTPVDIPRG